MVIGFGGDEEKLCEFGSDDKGVEEGDLGYDGNWSPTF